MMERFHATGKFEKPPRPVETLDQAEEPVPDVSNPTPGERMVLSGFREGALIGDFTWNSERHTVKLGGDVRGVVPLEERDALLAQEVAHGGVDVLVGAADVEAAGAQHGGKRGHGGAADADQVNVAHMASLQRRA